MMAFRALFLVGGCSCALLLACGGSADSSSGDGDGDGDLGSGGSSSGGSSSGGSSSGGSSTGGTGVDDVNADFTVDVFKFFSQASQTMRPSSPAIGAAPSACELHDSGDCRVSVCPLADPVDIEYQYRDAGTVTASFTWDVATITATAVPEANGLYTSVNFLGDYQLGGGEPGSITAEGGDVGAFSQDVAFPLLLINTGTVTGAAGDYRIVAPRTQDLVLTWDRGVAGVNYHVQAQSSITDATHRYGLSCQFDSTAGTGMIPTDLMTRLPSGGLFYAFTVAEYEQTVGEDVVLMRVITETTVPAKDDTVLIELLD